MKDHSNAKGVKLKGYSGITSHRHPVLSQYKAPVSHRQWMLATHASTRTKSNRPHHFFFTALRGFLDRDLASTSDPAAAIFRGSAW
eukprot:CAMPEP_0119111246 /NCGR_PEP_ID=MMETSP1180-20130426/34731_1 /TAXON_ID=3052 ORGANISM="Chlamydomonas cf sp, Strain CCMP681" /NCGR_SAMPLE_ID=MMETSP1180 /ASSEMBLY_ACC=CAM_ASM_000741 /LENGTH=85 /DNA_ID=CAMNT_0007098105 /DNA_START=58 /DNA_END=315 /DNA_ORIENTATION=-